MDDVFADIQDALEGVAQRADDHPQEPARDREDGRRRGARGRDDRARRRAASPGRHDRASSTTPRVPSSASTAASPPRRATRAIPKAICISPNDVVVHGIPDGFVVGEGDLVTIDVGVTLDGYIADSAYTFGVGEIEAEDQRLLDVAQDALAAGIAEAVVGNRVGDVSHAIQEVVEAGGFSVVRSLVGHGVGRHYHEDPHIPNFGEPGRGPRLSEGMTIAIEPMITAGSPEVLVMDDGWTIRTHRRLDVGPLRAHGRDHRRRPADPHAARRRTGRRRGLEVGCLLRCPAAARAFRCAAVLTGNPPTERSIRARSGSQGREDRDRGRGRRSAPQHDVPGAARQRSQRSSLASPERCASTTSASSPATASRSSSLPTTSLAAESPSG